MFWQYYDILELFSIINVSEKGHLISGSVFFEATYKQRFTLKKSVDTVVTSLWNIPSFDYG